MASLPLLSIEVQARSQGALEEWIRSVLRETVLWGIQSQLEECSSTEGGGPTIRLKSVDAALAVCQRMADIWVSNVRSRGLILLADTIQSVARKRRDDLYLPIPQDLVGSADRMPAATVEAPKISDPIQRWSLLYNLKRENAHETLDQLMNGNPYHKLLVQQKSQLPNRPTVAIPTTASEEVIIRKRKSYHLKQRTVRDPRPTGRPRKPRTKVKHAPPRPPVDPQEAFENSHLTEMVKKEISEEVFCGEDEDADTRLIAAVVKDPKGLPARLQAPVIFEAKDGIYVLPMVKIKYNEDPTKEATKSPLL